MPASLRPWYLPLGLSLLVTLLALGGSELATQLRFDRAALGQGQWWRLFSAHLVHLGGSHTALNVAGLALIWGLVGGAFDERQWLGIMAGLMLGISLGLWLFNPQLGWYVGLSGVLHGMLAAGALAQLRRGERQAMVLLLLVGAKLVWEQWSGPLPGSEATAGGAVIVDAHLYGGIIGLLPGALLRPATPASAT